MIYYYIKNENGFIGIGGSSSDKLEHGVEITKEQHDILVNELQNNQLIYQDKSGELKSRDRLTKYDKLTKKWIPDDDAIAKEKQELFIAKAKQALIDTAEYESESYKAVCTEEENQANFEYRVALRKIVKGMYNGTDLPIDPNKKEE